jgi:hypothetical protein
MNVMGSATGKAYLSKAWQSLRRQWRQHQFTHRVYLPVLLGSEVPHNAKVLGNVHMPESPFSFVLSSRKEVRPRYKMEGNIQHHGVRYKEKNRKNKPITLP